MVVGLLRMPRGATCDDLNCDATTIGDIRYGLCQTPCIVSLDAHNSFLYSINLSLALRLSVPAPHFLAAVCHSNMSGGLSNGQLQVDPILKQEADVPVHRFDPDASPEEKAAQAGKGREQLASVKPTEPKERGECSCVGLACPAAPNIFSPFFWLSRNISCQC